jgi:hypothetical protein
MSKRDKLPRKIKNNPRGVKFSEIETLDYYLSLPYTVEAIPDKEDGSWYIRIKELPGCMTQADSWEDLLPMIEEAK